MMTKQPTWIWNNDNRYLITYLIHRNKIKLNDTKDEIRDHQRQQKEREAKRANATTKKPGYNYRLLLFQKFSLMASFNLNYVNRRHMIHTLVQRAVTSHFGRFIEICHSRSRFSSILRILAELFSFCWRNADFVFQVIGCFIRIRVSLNHSNTGNERL